MITRFRRYMACRRLARMVEHNRSSFKIIQYRKHREAALKGARKVRG